MRLSHAFLAAFHLSVCALLIVISRHYFGAVAGFTVGWVLGGLAGLTFAEGTRCLLESFRTNGAR